MKATILAALAVASAAAASAQNLTLGNPLTNPNSGDWNTPGAVRTDVELTHPANATGTLTSVTFHWSSSGCASAVKVKVFRRVGDDFTLVAQRGPLSVSADPTTFALEPGIAVLQGDLIGLARVADCGSPEVVTPGYDAYYLGVSGDATSFSYSSGTVYGDRLLVYATGTASEVVAGVLPSVASNPGRGGTYYRTLVQALAMFSFSPASGRFVFHQKRVPGGPNDPSMDFSVPGGDVVSWTDLQASMGATGSPGSVDVVVPWGHMSFMIGAQVYNDKGEDGTSGFREEMVNTVNHGFGVGTNIFFAGATGYLFGPADTARYRSNIAIRSLEAGVEATLQAYREDGSAAGSPRSLRYPPNTWDQDTWDMMTGTALQGGDYLRISVSRGSALFENSITDNVTGDSADVLARVFAAVL